VAVDERQQDHANGNERREVSLLRVGVDFKWHKEASGSRDTFACAQRGGAGSVARRRLIGRPQRLEKCHQCSGLRRAQIFSIGWHISSALDYLTYELVFGEA
jgi:hypothetical protein